MQSRTGPFQVHEIVYLVFVMFIVFASKLALMRYVSNVFFSLHSPAGIFVAVNTLSYIFTALPLVAAIEISAIDPAAHVSTAIWVFLGMMGSISQSDFYFYWRLGLVPNGLAPKSKHKQRVRGGKAHLSVEAYGALPGLMGSTGALMGSLVGLLTILIIIRLNVQPPALNVLILVSIFVLAVGFGALYGWGAGRLAMHGLNLTRPSAQRELMFLHTVNMLWLTLLWYLLWKHVQNVHNVMTDVLLLSSIISIITLTIGQALLSGWQMRRAARKRPA